MAKKLVVTDEVKGELEAIAEAHEGLLRPADVVEAARQEGTALHAYMDSQGLWDPDTAQEYALSMAARLLIMRVKVTLLDRDSNEPIRTRAWVSLADDRQEGRGYRNVLTVMHSEDSQAALLETARKELGSFAKKYRKLSKLSGVIAAIDDELDDDLEAAG